MKQRGIAVSPDLLPLLPRPADPFSAASFFFLLLDPLRDRELLLLLAFLMEVMTYNYRGTVGKLLRRSCLTCKSILPELV